MAKKWTIKIGEKLYPEKLYELSDPPKIIYGMGDPEVLNQACISIIGARRATPYGLANAESAARIAVESDLCVVTGGAKGCDAAASRECLRNGGKTILVVGTGADVVYPTSSQDLFERASEGEGAVISLDSWGTNPRRWAFVRRNKIIAALSAALIITEAGLKSGTMSTASFAAELGRELFVIPGSIYSPESQGANELIANGANIICSEQYLETQIALSYGKIRLVKDKPLTNPGRIMSALYSSPMRPDDMANKLGLQFLEVLNILADYEALGLVKRLMDGRFSPTVEAYKTIDKIGTNEIT